MIIQISQKQKTEIGHILKEYLRGNRSGGQKIKRIQDRIKRNEAYLAAYNLFSRNKKDAYKVAELYNIRVCPYCNINYTYVVNSGRKHVCRPDFDHFVAKTDYPKKAMNVLNLIPSCQQCNSRVKLDKHFSRRTHIHPYFDDFDKCFTFDYKPRKIPFYTETDIDIKIRNPQRSSRVKNFIADMKLVARYQKHKDVVMSIIKRARRYPINSKGFMDVYSKLCNKRDLIDLIYPELSCSYLDESLGKLKKDIATKVFKIMKSNGAV